MEVKIVNKHLFDSDEDFHVLYEKYAGLMDEIDFDAREMKSGEERSYKFSVFGEEGMIDFQYAFRVLENEEEEEGVILVELVSCSTEKAFSI
ncbi:hypothetical protein ACSMFR_02280 [Listeria aquatica]|uniref:hypothetical protein n=1 Tax=Listeria aquatica TaxID=1494960 RepID=UPI003F712E33